MGPSGPWGGGSVAHEQAPAGGAGHCSAQGEVHVCLTSRQVSSRLAFGLTLKDYRSHDLVAGDCILTQSFFAGQSYSGCASGPSEPSVSFVWGLRCKTPRCDMPGHPLRGLWSQCSSAESWEETPEHRLRGRGATSGSTGGRASLKCTTSTSRTTTATLHGCPRTTRTGACT